MADVPDLHLALARLEGKIDAWSMQHDRHEERLNGHSAKLDALQTQVAELRARFASQDENRRVTPSWPTVVSTVIAAVSLVLLIAQQLYGG